MKKTYAHQSFFYFFTFMVLSLVFFSCDNTDNSRATQVKKGKVLFDKYCTSCHGIDAKGIANAEAETKRADLTLIMKSRKATQFPISEIARYIDGRSTIKSHGTREMPIWGNELKEKESLQTNDELRGKLGEIIAYLMTIQDKQ